MKEPISTKRIQLRKFRKEQVDLLSVFVDKPFRRQGIATKLLQALEQELEKRKCQKICVEYETGRPDT